MPDRLLKSLSFFIILLMCVFVVWQSYLHTPINKPQQNFHLILHKGDTFQDLAEALRQHGWIRTPKLFSVSARLLNKANSLQAGEYDFEPGRSLHSILAKLTSGEVVIHELTLIEGWTLRDILAAMSNAPSLKHDAQDMNPIALSRQLGLPPIHPEGWFFPETYQYTFGTKETELLARALHMTTHHLDELWKTREKGLYYQTPYDALIVASMIEKEAARDDERNIISAVILRRLIKKMPLQIDSTIVYSLGEKFKSQLHKRDLQKDSPYNSYLHPGLPPTPISNPGRKSMEAALHPAKTDLLYFVARGDGSHRFSSTLAAHEQAVKKYQK